MANDTANEAAGTARAQAGLYLTFSLGKEVYGLEILRVQEIIGMQPVTHVPRVPDFVRGVINLRGKVIPVVDLRLKFGMESVEDTSRTCIVVLQVESNDQKVTMGTIVDEVCEVLDVTNDQIEPPPSFGTSVETDYILGMGKLEDKVVMLLDVDRVFATSVMNILAEVAGNQ